MDVNSETQRSRPEVGVEHKNHQVLPEVDLGLLSSPERLLGASVEALETKSERPVAGVGVGEGLGSATPVAPVADNQSSTDDSGSSASSSAPIQASDGDRIEQEWVDRVKSVLAATIDNPYEREEKIKDLQADYIFKRYGRRIGQQETAT